MICSNTSFGKLKTVVVGRELEINQRIVDLTFKLFYKENLKQELYDEDVSYYKISTELLQQRNTELDNLAKTLSMLGVNVRRPERLNRLVKFQTPFFKSECSSASNVRDITLVYGNKIIEMPMTVRNRYFENMLLYNVFNEAYDNGNGGMWIKAPNTYLSNASIDTNDWKLPRDFNNIPSGLQMAIDGAQFIRIGKDAIVNVSTYNHWLGLNWIKSFFNDVTFHVMKIADNHIDGALICLRPGTFLVNPLYKDAIDKQLPEKFKSWKQIVPCIAEYPKVDNNIALASQEGMDINILSIDQNTVLVNKRSINVIRALEQEKFNVITVELNNCELFGGGIHCSTLDIQREDDMISYI